MKSFRNINATSTAEAVRALGQDASAMLAGGGSDLLGLVKEHTLAPNTLVSLKRVASMEGIERRGNELRMGGLVTLDAIGRNADIRQRYTVLAEAASQVATPQIRNVGTIAGNIVQRPWCWYFRNNFPCFKNGGNTCYSITGENDYHAIFGGGPSYIVHPSDTAVALVALDARVRIEGANGNRTLAASDFFQLPTVNPAKENALAQGEIVTEILLPEPAANTRSTYRKVLDRESWTHAIVSVAAVLQMDGATCRSARIVLGGVAPIPWRVPAAEAMLAGQRPTEDLLARVGEKAIEGARPLAKNAYKIPLTRATVKEALRTASGANV